MKYGNLLSAFYGSAWAITEPWYRTIEGVLLERARGTQLSREELRARIDSAETPVRDSDIPKGFAVVPVHGPIIPRASLIDEVSSVTSHEAVAKQVRAAADNDDVRHIVLNIASPGGAVEGVSSSVEAVRYAASKKPVTAVSEGLMCSAAYWIASQATRVLASPSAQVGSIGVLVSHTDISRLEEDLGIKTTVFRSGSRKALGYPGEPLDDATREDLQRQIDELFDAFARDVAQGRKRSVAEVRDEYGDGAVYGGLPAYRLRLTDGLGTLASVLSEPPTRRRFRAQASLKSEARGDKTMDEELTLETLQAEYPEVFAKAKALGYKEGYEAGRAEVVAATPTDNPEIQRLENLVVSLNARLEATERQARDDRRRSIAMSALEAAKLPPFPKVEGHDFEGSFKRRLEAASLGAETDDEARAAVDAIILEQKAMMGATHERKAREPQRLVPLGNSERKVIKQTSDTEAEAQPMVSNIRKALGLPN